MIRTILLVEDDLADSRLIGRAFGKAGFPASLVRVKDGDEAVAYLDGTGPYEDREQHPLPSMILLDIKLPRRSGFEVLSWIRRDSRPLRRIPVIVLTSSRHSTDINRAYELGANAYTVKPDTIAELTELLTALNEFWVRKNEFPLLAISMESSALAAIREGDSHARPVLIIEDERPDATLIMRAFERAGFSGQIKHAPDARSALEWLDGQIGTGNSSDLPTLVLLDLKLPGMSGFEFLDEIRNRPKLKQVPVVVLTVARDSETMNRAYERGANSYLLKSPDPDEINRIISFLQQYWLTVNQSAPLRTS